MSLPDLKRLSPVLQVGEKEKEKEPSASVSTETGQLMVEKGSLPVFLKVREIFIASSKAVSEAAKAA